MRVITIAVIAAVGLATGCYTEADVGYRLGYTTPSPDLVYVSPGVQVVADFDVPVFFADGMYWRYAGGVWYRSYSHSGGWQVTTSVPVAVRRIDRPERFAHYRAATPAPAPNVRDHRTPQHAQAVKHPRAHERERERDHRR
jgi:hypothetical protein